MKLQMFGLEDYTEMNDKQLTREILKLQMELKQVDEDMDNDHNLQAAIAMAQSMKLPYTMRKKQIMKLQKTLHELARARRLYDN